MRNKSKHRSTHNYRNVIPASRNVIPADRNVIPADRNVIYTADHTTIKYNPGRTK